MFCINCKSQKPNSLSEDKASTIQKKSNSMYQIPIVNSDFEKFNFQKTKVEYLANLKKRGDLQNPKADSYSYYYDEKIENRIINKYYNETKKDGVIYATESIFYDNSPFVIKKTFYPNGNIKEKGLYILQGNVYKGIWYYFDENGKLTHSIDNDKPYKFRWEDIEKFMIDHNIPILLGYKDKFGSTEVNRTSALLFPASSVTDATLTTEKAVWTISWRGETFNQYYSATLDGENGKILYRSKYWLSQEGEEVPEPIVEDFTDKK